MELDFLAGKPLSLVIEYHHTDYKSSFGVDYAFINESTVDIFVDQGVNLFRVAFLLERMCPREYGLGRKFNETYFDEFNAAICYITETKGMIWHLIIDSHFPTS